MLKKLESILFRFLWNNKPDKVSRKVTYLPIKKGGLGMVDIDSFWSSMRFSWFRRISSSEAFWTNILKVELQKINSTIESMLYFSKGQMLVLSKIYTNPFWKNTFKAASDLLSLIQFHSPYKFFLFPVVGNPLFKLGNQNIKLRIFRANLEVNLQVADFFIEGTTQFYSVDFFNDLHDTNVTIANYDRLKAAILGGIGTLGDGLDEAELHIKPRQPLITHIASKSLRGCHYINNIIRSKENHKTNPSKLELKWHLQLNSI